jgi:hypothetical protein
MRELTFEEIDQQLAEQLPSRELMGSCGRSSCNPCQPSCEPKCDIEVAVKVCIAL